MQRAPSDLEGKNLIPRLIVIALRREYQHQIDFRPGFIDEMLELFCPHDKESIGIPDDITILLFGFLSRKMTHFGFTPSTEYN